MHGIGMTLGQHTCCSIAEFGSCALLLFVNDTNAFSI